MLKLQGNTKKHSKTGGFYASKSEVTTDKAELSSWERRRQ
jgi:hypothetical protein